MSPVLVYPGAGPGYKDSPHRLQFAREVARKIEAKITAISLKNGKRIVNGGTDETVRLWDVEMGTLLQTLKGHKGEVLSVSFSPDGKRIASGSADRTVRLWDAGTGNLLKTLRGHKSDVASVSFSPEGRRLVSGSLDGTVRLWDAIKGRHLQTLKGHKGEVLSVSFSPDGKRIASGGTGRDGSTLGCRHWRPLANLRNAEGHCWECEFVAGQQNARQWGYAGGQCVYGMLRRATFLKILTGHTESVTSVSFSPDGKRIVSGSVDENNSPMGYVLGLNDSPSHYSIGLAGLSFRNTLAISVFRKIKTHR